MQYPNLPISQIATFTRVNSVQILKTEGSAQLTIKLATSVTTKGHLAKLCRSKKFSNKLDVNVTSESNGEPDDSEFYFGHDKSNKPKNQFTKSSSEPVVAHKETHLHANTIKSNQWTATLDLNGSNVDFKLDSAFGINVLPKSVYNNLLERPKLKSTNIKLSTYNNTDIPVLGTRLLQ